MGYNFEQNIQSHRTPREGTKGKKQVNPEAKLFLL